jgi:hypothetical protein
LLLESTDDCRILIPNWHQISIFKLHIFYRSYTVNNNSRRHLQQLPTDEQVRPLLAHYLTTAVKLFVQNFTFATQAKGKNMMESLLS